MSGYGNYNPYNQPPHGGSYPNGTGYNPYNTGPHVGSHVHVDVHHSGPHVGGHVTTGMGHHEPMFGHHHTHYERHEEHHEHHHDMTVGIPQPTAKPPACIGGIYSKHAQAFNAEQKATQIRSMSIRRENTQSIKRRRSMDPKLVQRSKSVITPTKATDVKTETTEVRPIPPSTRIRRYSGSALATSDGTAKSTEAPTKNSTIEKKDSKISRRRSMGATTLPRRESDDITEELKIKKTLTVIAEMRQKKKEEEERKRKEDEAKAVLYEEKFQIFKANTRNICQVNEDLRNRIEMLQKELGEINIRQAQLAETRDLSLIPIEALIMN